MFPPRRLYHGIAALTAPSAGQVIFDSRSAALAGAAGRLTWSYPHTVGELANRLLVVMVTTRSTTLTDHSAVRWGGSGGTLMTRRVQVITDIAICSIWYLLESAITSGTQDVHITVAGSVSGGAGSQAVSLANVVQEAPLFASGGATSGSFVQTSTALTPLSPNSRCEAVCCFRTETVTSGVPQAPLSASANIAISNHRFLTASGSPLSVAVTPRYNFGVSDTMMAIAAVLFRPIGS